MGILARLDPRHWGGRRVLHFLTGLALAAVALVAVLDVPAAPAGTVGVTAAAPVEFTPAGDDGTPAEHDATPAGGVGPEVSEAEAGYAASGPASPVAAVPGAPKVVLQLTAVTGTVVTPPTGSTPASLGSRAPPLR